VKQLLGLFCWSGCVLQCCGLLYIFLSSLQFGDYPVGTWKESTSCWVSRVLE